jgi:hypothetical protein
MDGNLQVKITADASQLHHELDKAVARVKQVRADLANNGFVPAVFGFFGGRCTAFAIAFFTIGVFLELRGKLDANFVALAGIIQALILAHSAKEDYHERNYNPGTNVNVSVSTDGSK